jgi:tRNA-2-methylthio-N6-dimethylallyladenosine synthase
MHRKAYVRTYGCQMNEVDSALMEQVLGEAGYVTAEGPEDADLILVNTCSVRQKAEDKVYTDLGSFRDLRRGGRLPLIGVAGCVARHRAHEILRMAPWVDLVFGPDAIADLPAMIDEVERTGRPVVRTDIPAPADAPFLQLTRVRPRQVSAFVTVMRGCDRYCSYCIVPYVRGPEVSRPADEVLREVSDLLARGVREVTLLGQNVNSYGKTPPLGVAFPDLLDRVAALPGLARLRFVTSHPHDCSPALLERFVRLPSLCEYLHLPAQAGSDDVLRRMNRRYTVAEYLEKVAAYRALAPGGHLSTDLIVGFPGETDADFEATLRLVEAARFDTAFSFKYSPRDGTAAARLPDDVPAAVKSARLTALQARLNQLAEARLDAYADQRVEVLIEGTSKRTDAHLAGRTRTNVVVNVVPPEGHADLQGALVDVQIRRVHRHSLFGEAVGGPR